MEGGLGVLVGQGGLGKLGTLGGHVGQIWLFWLVSEVRVVRVNCVVWSGETGKKLGEKNRGKLKRKLGEKWTKNGHKIGT